MSVFIFSCNTNQQPTTKTNVIMQADSCFLYPVSVDSMQIKNLYDSARWYIYLWHCDQYYNPKSDTAKSISFGELILKFDNLTFKHDTLELTFKFMDKQQPILPSMTRDYKELVTGVGFDMKTKNKIYMLSPNGFSTTIKGGTNRYANPLQPVVLSYIKSSWDK